MKKVLLDYNFSYPAGGGDYLPLFFAAELMKSCEVTLAIDMKSWFEKSCAFFCMESALSGLRDEQLMPAPIRTRARLSHAAKSAERTQSATKRIFDEFTSGTITVRIQPAGLTGLESP